MGYTIAQKIIKSHLVSGEMIPGTEIGLRIDQTFGRMPPVRWHTSSWKQWESSG